MNVSALIGKARRLADENAPVILTGMAVSGAFLASWFTYKGTIKSAGQIIEKQLKEIGEGNTSYEPTPLDTLQLTWKNYIPAVAALGGTSACMIMATKIGLDRTAAMAGALVVTERTYDQYKEKVKETLGENKHVKVSDAVAQDRAQSTPSPQLNLTDGEQICFDEWSGRFFKSSMEKLKSAENDFNKDLLFGSYASLNDYYRRIGLGDVGPGNDIGWNKEGLLEVIYSSVLKDNTPCIVIQFDKGPMSTFQDDYI